MSDAESKAHPGKDQNHVLEAMRIGRGTFGLKYAYLTNNTAPLLDKLVLFNSNLYELGGSLMQDLLHQRQSLLVHTTCYEKSTKVMGLKASNAYWNPFYYQANRRTITKPILYVNDRQLLEEVRSLLFLGALTERAVILPNLLGRAIQPNYRIQYQGQHMWPGYRVLHIKKPAQRFKHRFEEEWGGEDAKPSSETDLPPLPQVLEPAFYWRVRRDYSDPPSPKTVVFGKQNSLVDVYRALQAPEITSTPRLVLHGGPCDELCKQQIASWAEDSIGVFAESFDNLLRRYVPLPTIRAVRQISSEEEDGKKLRDLAADLLEGLRTCKKIFDPPTGNRTCFQICD